MKNDLKTGLEKNKKYIVDYRVGADCYTTYIYTTSQKKAKAMLKSVIPDAKKIVAKCYECY